MFFCFFFKLNFHILFNRWQIVERSDRRKVERQGLDGRWGPAAAVPVGLHLARAANAAQVGAAKRNRLQIERLLNCQAQDARVILFNFIFKQNMF